MTQQATIVWEPAPAPTNLFRYCHRERVVSIDILEDPEDEGSAVTHEVGAEDIEIPVGVQRALHRAGLCDYNEARNLNLATLFDLLETRLS